jgi:hypothetical protein
MRNQELTERMTGWSEELARLSRQAKEPELKEALAQLSRGIEAIRIIVYIEGVFFNPTTPDHSGDHRPYDV